MPNAVVTGANRGIGLEFVKQLSKAGYNVYAGYRTFSQEMEDACNGMIQPLDVSQQQSVDDFTSNLPSSIDLLINNAGVADGRWQSVEDIDDNIALEVLNINAVGPVRMMKSISEKLSDGAKVVMITSLMASMEDCKTGRSYAYRASKAALNMFSLAMKNELKTRNISLLLMHPGWVRTDMGGPHAEVSVVESVEGMMKQIGEHSIENTGTYMDFQGNILPW